MSEGADGQLPVVALLMAGLADLGGGGGTERFYLNLHAAYASRGQRFHLLLLADRRSVDLLRATGRELDAAQVVPLPAAGRLGGFAQALAVRRACRELSIDILHVPLPSPRHLLSLWLAGRSRPQGPRLVIGAVDCTFAHALRDRRLRRDRDIRRAYWLYRLFPIAVRLDGVYTWYRLFEERMSEWWQRGQPLVRSAHCFFVDTEAFRPARRKSPVVVYAGRLVASKRPMLFVEAMAEAMRLAPEAFDGWKVKMFGRGPLEREVNSRIEDLGLAGRIELAACPDLAAPLATASVFVSTQDFENFSSLAMLEAMASGNAVVARDVGQTRELVRPGRNGWLSGSEDAHELAACLVSAVADPQRLARYGAESRRITLEEHCVSRFIEEIETFWCDVLAAHRVHRDN